ncbi:MAG: GTP-binding protein [Candidatus Lokiarchaeota archaeon]|nr:GTP-binding protein [Candidatus Lokiarchaeota archaeon]
MVTKERILNVLVAGHAQHGKSSLIEAIVGKFPDNLDYELSHGTTVSLKVIQFVLKRQSLTLNFLDTPGHADFQGGIALGLEFADLLVLVISGTDGFQARTHWLYEKARERDLPIIIAATKMDLPNSNVERINSELKKLGKERIPIIQTSAKKITGIENLIERISVHLKKREFENSELAFVILGFKQRKGLGEMLNIGLTSGALKSGQWLNDKIKIRQVVSLANSPLKQALEGEIVTISLNVKNEFELGTQYHDGKFIPPKTTGLLSNLHPRKEFVINIDDPEKFKIATEILENLKKVITSFDFFVNNKNINILVLGDLQFDFIKEKLEDLIEFKVISSKLKGVITINAPSKGKYNSASVRIFPRTRKKLTISRGGNQEKRLFDLLGASTAYEAFHLDGLHVDILSGKNEDDIAQAIAKAVEKVKIIKIDPRQDIIVKVENYHDLFSLIEKYNIEVLYQSQAHDFFLQIKNQEFEPFFNSLMKISKGKADINLFTFKQKEVILAVDPGTRHFGFCLIQHGELPELWYVNLKSNIKDLRSQSVAKQQIEEELGLFFSEKKELINKIFVGHGPGSDFIIDFFIEYFGIPCDNLSCVKSNLNDLEGMEQENVPLKNRFEPPDIFLVDEFKTTKEAMFHLQQGKLVNEVRAKGFVDHAIAALLIAKRGIKGETIKIEKKPLKQLHDYIFENYSGSFSFATIHNINSLEDLKSGTFLRIKDSSKLDSNLNNGDIVTFIGFGRNYSSFHAVNLSGNRMIVNFQGNVKVKRDFFKIFMPVKERN